MIRLVEPSPALHASWLASMQEFGGAVLHGYSTFRFEVEELAVAAGFERWLERERLQNERGIDGFVPATAWWIVDDAAPGTVLGSIHLRHELNEWLLAEGGHIGYGVRPSARGRGVATAALLLVLERARAMGIERVLLCCESDNPASRATIVAAGGVLEDVRESAEHGRYERYWIALG
ncbi:GNAT family N-acetyltransferase [Agrococcus sp. ARC_14]|uniref:GNAT family N-acetyltransferase n=1 Tax=Agrococcus sp. ARC_14 TaxID=2919927 RepID=UPI001F05EF6F|nr:GNAT family N-acetyltransferase [Agrococcus sp. ARC_14]MCH1883623.1 GNAT family N-acetyltransferase [Agrococcus sp. ARC_14]